MSADGTGARSADMMRGQRGQMHLRAGHFLAWPGGEHLAASIVLGTIFVALFLVFYGGASLLAPWIPWRIHVDLPFEARIPFVPAAAYIYLSIVPVLTIAPFVLRDLRGLLPLFCALSVQTLIGSMAFILLPVEPSLADRALPAADSTAFALADWLNMNGNYLPSLHVAFATTAAIAYAERGGRLGKLLLFVWALAVAASTLLTHQHYVLDVILGAVLSWVTWRWVAPWARRPGVLEAADVELLCLVDYARFSRRHVRYFFISCTLLARSMPAFRQRRLLRTGFALLQSIDDLMDGDRRSDREPLDIAEEMAVSLRSDVFDTDGLSRLARAFRSDLVARGGDAALDQAIELIQTMAFDRVRVQQSLLLDAEALQAHHRTTFRNSMDLLLLAADGELRSADAPELIDALGWCSTVRDLADDLERGLINVPRHIVEAARRRSAESVSAVTLARQDSVEQASAAALARSPVVLDWLANEATRVLAMLDLVDGRLAPMRNRPGADVLSLFSRSVRRYAKRWGAERPHATRMQAAAQNAPRAITSAQPPDEGCAEGPPPKPHDAPATE